MESLRPDIFISATTRDLGSIRTLVKNALLDLGAHPIEQEHFAPAGKTVAAMLRERLSGCRAVIHIVGHCYGAEDATSEAARAHCSYAEGRRSYTQIEHDIALELGVEIYVFLCGDTFPYTPHDSEPEELHQLQQSHRQRLLSGNHLKYKVATEADLREHLRRLEDRVKLLAEQLQREKRRHRRTLIGAVVAIVLLALGLWAAKERIDWIERHNATQVKEQGALNAGLLARIEALEKQNRPNRAAVATVLANATAGARTTGTGGDAAEAQTAAAAELGLSVEELRQRLTAADTNAAERVKLAEQLEQRAQADAQTARIAKRNALRDLGDAASAAGRYREAIAHYRLASPLFDREKEPLGWATLQNRLALALHAQSEYTEAETLLRSILAIREVQLDAHHPDLALSLNNLAGLLRETGRLDEAEPLYRRALAIGEIGDGADDPGRSTVLNNYGVLLFKTNRPAEAESMLRQALAIDEKTLGADHPRVASELSNLAGVLYTTDRRAEAESLYRRALAIDEKKLGQDHPKVARDLNNLADFFCATNRREEAEHLYRRALAIDEKTFGPENPRVASVLSNLAALLHATNRLEEAEPLYRRIVWIHGEIERKGGQPDHAFEVAKKSYSAFLHDLLRRGQRVPVGEILRRVETAVEGKDVERPGN